MKETVDCGSPGTWCGVCGIPGPEVGVLEDVWSTDHGYGTLPDLLAEYDGINHSFLINRVALSGQSGGFYRTDGSTLSKLSYNREWTMDASPHRTRPWRYLLLRNLAVT